MGRFRLAIICCYLTALPVMREMIRRCAKMKTTSSACVTTEPTGSSTPTRGVRTQRMFVRSDATQLADLVGRVDAGHLQIDIADRRPLTDAAAVHDAIGCSVRPFLFRRISDGATFRKTARWPGFVADAADIRGNDLRNAISGATVRFIGTSGA